MRRFRGITLVELMVAAAIVAGITAVTAKALGVGFNTTKTIENSRTLEQKRVEFEDQVTQWIRIAWLAPSTAEPASYFIGQVGAMSPGDASQIIQTPAATAGATGTTGTAGATGSTSPTMSGGSGGAAPTDNPLKNSGNSDDLTFTAVGTAPPVQLFTSTDDWETANQDIGPQGGVAEVCLSLVPQDGTGPQKGLFIRIQRPADQDPTQGGFERLLSADVASIGYEYYDGQNWDPTWDTRLLTPQQLPAAVRVTYRFESDQQDHVFVVMLPYSNVTAANPVENPPTNQ